MEKNQHNTEKQVVTKGQHLTGEAPGQTLPAGDDKIETDRMDDPHAEKHSSSSRPQSDNETLGTP